MREVPRALGRPEPREPGAGERITKMAREVARIVHDRRDPYPSHPQVGVASVTAATMAAPAETVMRSNMMWPMVKTLHCIGSVLLHYAPG